MPRTKSFKINCLVYIHNIGTGTANNNMRGANIDKIGNIGKNSLAALYHISITANNGMARFALHFISKLILNNLNRIQKHMQKIKPQFFAQLLGPPRA